MKTYRKPNEQLYFFPFTIFWRQIMNECYQTFEQKVRIGHYHLISCFSNSDFYFILYSENRCISKLDKIGIFIDMKFH